MTQAMQLNPRRLMQPAIVLTALLFVGHVITVLLEHVVGTDDLFAIGRFLHFDHEGNAPTFWSTLLLLLIAGLLVLVNRVRGLPRRWHRLYQYALCVIVLLMAADEMFQLHERVIDDVRGWFGGVRALYFGWVVPYAGVALAIVAASWSWWRALLPRVQWRLAIDVACYVLGALGFELLGGWYFGGDPTRIDIIYAVFFTIEETLEMVGLLCVISGLLTQLAEAGEPLHVRFGPTP